MTPKQAKIIHMFLRYLCVSCVIVFGVISIIGSGGGGGDGGGGSGSAPDISNLSFSPTSTLEGSGGGTIPVSGTLDFVDNDGNVSTLTLTIFDSNDNQLDSTTDPINGVSGLTSGTIQGVFNINTSVAGEYPLEVYITDTTNLSSNILSGIFTVIYDDTNDLDSTFGIDGIALYESTPNNREEEGRAIAIQTDGKIVVAGNINDGISIDILILRYNSDGTLDDTFGTNGVVLYDGGEEDKAYAISLQPDGKILIVGYSNTGDPEHENILVLRYNSDGKLDTTFGTNGVVSTHVEDVDKGYAVDLQTDGKIVVAGETSNSYVLVLRYNSDGTLDTTFGINGIVKYVGGSGIDLNIAYGVTIQSDEKIVITGKTEAYPQALDTDILILRYNSDGALDNTFGTNGIVTYHNVDYAYETGKAIKFQADGKIVIAGLKVLLRYTDNGTLDNTFGTNGVVKYKCGTSTIIYGYSFSLQTDAKIVVVGACDSDMMILKYNSNGTLDTSFSGDGAALYSSGFGAIGYGIAIQNDGKIVASGRSTLHDGDPAVLTIRIIGQ